MSTDLVLSMVTLAAIIVGLLRSQPTGLRVASTRRWGAPLAAGGPHGAGSASTREPGRAVPPRRLVARAAGLRPGDCSTPFACGQARRRTAADAGDVDRAARVH